MKIQFNTVIDALEHHRHSSHGITYIESGDSETFVSYQELYDNALALLKHFQDHGLQQGHQLILFINNNKLFLDAFWACLLGGITPVPVAIGISDEHKSKLFRIFNKLEKPMLYTDQKSLERLHQYLQSSEFDISSNQLNKATFVTDNINGLSTPGAKAQIEKDNLAFIQFSSGSTSEPKGVMLTHGNLIANIEGIGDSDKMDETDRSLGWMPLTHDLGIVGFHLNMLAYNVNQYLMPTDLFSRRPLLWLIKASEHKVTLLNSPNFGYKHFLKSYTAEKVGNLDLSSIRLIYNGAEPISVDLMEQFLQTMSVHGLKHTAMQPVYGLAEASLVVSLPEPEREPRHVNVHRHKIKIGDQVEFVPRDHADSVSFAIEGKPILNTHVKITDLDNNSLAENHVGDIQISGTNVTKGYYKNDEANASIFTQGGWLKTGDTGFMHNGELVVTGRSKEIIFVNGQNYFPHDLESIALKCPQLELGKVVAYGVTQDIAKESELLVFVLYRADLQDFIPVAREVTRLIGEYLGLEVNHVIPVKRIPKTTSGKIQRHLLGTQYLNGEFDDALAQIETQKQSAAVIETGDGHDIAQQFLAICNKIIEDKNIGLEDNLFELGISSLALTEIHQEIDELYPDQIEIDELFEHPTPAGLADLIKRKLDL